MSSIATTRARSSSLGVVNAVPNGLEDELLQFPPEDSIPEDKLRCIVESAQPGGRRIEYVYISIHPPSCH